MTQIRMKTAMMGAFAPLLLLPSTNRAESTTDLDKQSALVDVRVNRRDRVYHTGERVRATLRSRENSFIYVFYHQADGQAVMIYPTFATGTAAVSAGSRVNIAGDEEGVEIRVSKPYGREMMQVLVAKRPLSELENLIDYRARAYPALPTRVVDRYCRDLINRRILLGDARVEIQTVSTEGADSQREEQPTR